MASKAFLRFFMADPKGRFQFLASVEESCTEWVNGEAKHFGYVTPDDEKQILI